jgi:hypothetical protein
VLLPTILDRDSIKTTEKHYRTMGKKQAGRLAGGSQSDVVV